MQQVVSNVEVRICQRAGDRHLLSVQPSMGHLWHTLQVSEDFSEEGAESMQELEDRGDAVKHRPLDMALTLAPQQQWLSIRPTEDGACQHSVIGHQGGS